MRWLLIVIPIVLAALLIYLVGDAQPDRREHETNEQQAPAPEPTTAPPQQPVSQHATPPATADVRVIERRNRVVVTVRNPQGTPLEGILVSMNRGRGVPTGPDGRVQFDSVAPRMRFMVHPGGNFPPLPLGSPKSNRLDATLYPPRNVVLRTLVDGEPGLPDNWRLKSPTIVGMHVSEQAGEIRGQVASLSREVPLEFTADPQFLIEPADRKLRDLNGALDATLEFRRGSPVEIRVTDREWGRDLRIEVLQDDDTWAPPFGWERRPLLAPDGRAIRIRVGLLPGRYRVVLHTLGLPVQEFDITSSSTEVVLRSGNIRWVVLRLGLPQEYARPNDAGAMMRGKDLPPGVLLRNKKPILHPGDRDIEFTAWGPGLRPDPKRGRKTLKRGARLRLSAIASGTAVVQCRGARLLKMKLYSVEPPRRLTWAGSSNLRSGPYGFVFRNIPQGVYDVALFPRGYTPQALTNIVFGEGRTDLGSIEIGKNALIEFLPRNLAKDARLAVGATWLPFGIPIKITPGRGKPGWWRIHELPAGQIRLDFQSGHREWSRIVMTRTDRKTTIEVDCASE